VREIIQPILDGPLPDMKGNLLDMVYQGRQVKDLLSRAYTYRDAIIPFYELFTAPASHILDRYSLLH